MKQDGEQFLVHTCPPHKKPLLALSVEAPRTEQSHLGTGSSPLHEGNDTGNGTPGRLALLGPYLFCDRRIWISRDFAGTLIPLKR